MKSDTSPDAEAVEIELLRRATVAERFARVRDLTRVAIHHARRAITGTHPGCGQREIDLIFVETHYGKDLAEKLRRYPKGRQ